MKTAKKIIFLSIVTVCIHTITHCMELENLMNPTSLKEELEEVRFHANFYKLVNAIHDKNDSEILKIIKNLKADETVDKFTDQLLESEIPCANPLLYAFKHNKYNIARELILGNGYKVLPMNTPEFKEFDNQTPGEMLINAEFSIYNNNKNDLKKMVELVKRSLEEDFDDSDYKEDIENILNS